MRVVGAVRHRIGQRRLGVVKRWNPPIGQEPLNIPVWQFASRHACRMSLREKPHLRFAHRSADRLEHHPQL